MANGVSIASMSDLFVGLMSGTSMDAIDVVIVNLSRQHPEVVAAAAYPLPVELRAELLALCLGIEQSEVERLARLDVRLGRLFAEAVISLLKKAQLAPCEIRAIGSHGQTVRHKPVGPEPFTLQIGDPNIITQQTGITTVADFRRRDVAAGGQGAPLAPAFHAAVFRSSAEDRVILNIGGMANVTILPRDEKSPVAGFDTGPGNVLIDAWAAEHLAAPMDRDGAWAASGRVQLQLLHRLLENAYFRKPPPKSTGREYFNLDWLKRALKTLRPAPNPQDVQTTLCELTARTISDAILTFASRTKRVLVCGGGVHNAFLMERLGAYLANCIVESTDSVGLNPDMIEAIAFAWLAQRTLKGVAGNLPSVTGAERQVILGGIYLASVSP
jgi:Predicted molecular chaperone distantly related to HSP70-fold metalloproteases